jgi:hypothetical protein
MKKIFGLLTLVFSCSCFGQTYLAIEENHLLNCCTPTNVAPGRSTDEQLNKAFRYLVDTLKFQYKYVYGACENRAHFISTALKKKSIPHNKIWCFAPVRYSLISQKQLWVKDPLKITDTVFWTYHVAPVVYNANADTLVIDPSIAPTGPIPYKKWLATLNCPEAVYTFAAPQWYLFNSLDGFKAYNNFNSDAPNNIVLPKWFPNLITGDFFEYDPSTQNVPVGLAANDAAMLFYTNEKTNISSEDFKKVLGNINNILAFVNDGTNNTITPSFKAQYQQLVTRYAQYFRERKAYWLQTFSDLQH